MNTIQSLIKTLDQSGVAAAGESDSGGPTYVTSANGGASLVSMIQGIELGAEEADCRGAPNSPSGRICSTTVYSVSTKLIESKTGYGYSSRPTARLLARSGE